MTDKGVVSVSDDLYGGGVLGGEGEDAGRKGEEDGDCLEALHFDSVLCWCGVVFDKRWLEIVDAE